MADAMTIRITCKGAGEMPLDKIIALQGNLKELSKENYAKMKHSIVKHGFSFPLNIARIKGKPYGVIDGHQRHRAVKNMIEKEGFKLPGGKLPVDYVKCTSKNQAKQLILQAVSQYGKVTEDGLREFMEEANISFEQLPEIDIPDFKMNEFLESQGAPPPDDPDPEPKPDKQLTPITCPECGHEFTLAMKEAE